MHTQHAAAASSQPTLPDPPPAQPPLIQAVSTQPIPPQSILTEASRAYNLATPAEQASLARCVTFTLFKRILTQTMLLELLLLKLCKVYSLHSLQLSCLQLMLFR